MASAGYFRVGNLSQTIQIVPKEKHILFYSQNGKDEELGCIGHLRGDFAKSGNEFWTTWWPHCEDYKTQEFKDEFDNLINSQEKMVFSKTVLLCLLIVPRIRRLNSTVLWGILTVSVLLPINTPII